MRVLYTSFGFTNERYHLGSIYGSYGYKGADNFNFHRLPPFSIAEIEKRFTVDFSVFLLFDTVLIDRQTIWTLENPDESWILKQNRKEAKEGRANSVADEWVLQAYESLYHSLLRLQEEGFIEVVDYNSVLRPQQATLEQMLKDDLVQLRHWIEPLKDSMSIWRKYTEVLRKVMYEPDDETKKNANVKEFDSAELYDLRACIHNQSCISGGLYFLSRLLEHRNDVPNDLERYETQARHVLSDYLKYVNANILLSASLDSAFHDWSDYKPLYQAKFRLMRAADPKVKDRMDELHKLFSLVLPRFTVTDDKILIRILKDPRVCDLRQLVNDAVAGNIEIDEEFARKVLQDVIEDQYQLGCFKNIAGYLTLPLGFVPAVGTPVQKAAEEISSRIAKPKYQKRHRWFYLCAENTFSGHNNKWYRSLVPWSKRHRKL